MALLSAFSPGALGPEQELAAYCRSHFIEAGGDRIRSGLNVGFFAGLTVRVYPGWGMVGGIAFELTDIANYSSPGNASANQRWDRLVARRKWPSAEVELAVVPGVPAADPVLRPLTRVPDGVWEFGLAQWVVPGYSQGTIDYGRVWDHYADDGGRLSGDVDTALKTGNTYQLLALTAPNRDPQQFRVPGQARVALAVTVFARADVICAGRLTVDMAGRKESVRWKAPASGPLTIPVPVLQASIDQYGGEVPAQVVMTMEGEKDAATPLFVTAISAHQYAVLT